MSSAPAESLDLPPRQELASVVIRFAGDSGDGIQITGSQFTDTTALAGNDLATFPDFPAEIRAPTGTTFGVSAFQINFGARTIETSGDAPDVLVALNPAALKVNIDDLKDGGTVIIDSGAFSDRNISRAGFESDPREGDSLAKYRVVPIDISRLTLEAVKETGLSQRDSLRCKNFWTLGLIYWLYDRDRVSTREWLEAKFANLPDVAKANTLALNAGHAFGETAEMPTEIGTYSVPAAALEPGLYRNVTGTEAMAWGLAAGAQRASLEIVFCSYPITPASSLLHTLARMRNFGITTFQAEDEIAAASAAIGASYAGSLGITSSSGPGVALKTEAIGLAVACELPMIIVNSQRAGPSTGMPTKTEQSDLYQAVYGRNADSPLVVLATRSPSDCFDVAAEAVRLAVCYMTPVMVMSDTYIVNAAEPWMLPDVPEADSEPAVFHDDPEDFHAFLRPTDTLARPWVKPGTPGLAHRIGGLEKDYASGHISYDPENHHRMTMVRKAKIDGIVRDIPPQMVEQGGDKGQLAVVGWGSTYGPISRAVENARGRGLAVSHIHLRHLWPLPGNLGDLLGGFDKILVPEMNTGQLTTVLRDQYLVPAVGVNRVTGKPFKIVEIENAIDEILKT